MKTILRVSFFSGICILLIVCGQSITPTTQPNLSFVGTVTAFTTPLPVSPTSSLAWHPTDNLLAYLTENSQVLTILSVENMTTKGWKLPTTGFGDPIWSPDGNHIALVARDGSLWQIDYPRMENFEQLTEPMPVRDILWSPNSEYIAFINGSDIYTVDIVK